LGRARISQPLQQRLIDIRVPGHADLQIWALISDLGEHREGRVLVQNSHVG
jgi:hypothetical protein